MRKIIHRAAERGSADHGWLKTNFSFSFADWYDPTRMGFGALRVLNDDRIAPKSGFELHAHRDMEIITIVTGGAVTHEDSMGNRETISAGEVQVMTAGTGVAHAERNEKEAPLTLFQLWIVPRERGLLPRYAQYRFGTVPEGEFQLLVSPDGRGESILINQDAFIHRLTLGAGSSASYRMLLHGNGAYAFVISGAAQVAGQHSEARDAVGVQETSDFEIKASSPTELLIIEVPMVGTFH